MTWEDAPNLLGIFSDPEAKRYYRSTKDEAERASGLNGIGAAMPLYIMFMSLSQV